MQLPQCVRGGHHAAGCGTTCTHSYERRGARVHVYMHVHKYLLCIMCTVCIFILITMSGLKLATMQRAVAHCAFICSIMHDRARMHVRIYLVSEYRRPHGRSRRTTARPCPGAIPSPHLHTHTCTCTHTYTHLQTHMHTCTCTYTYAHTHTHTHPYT